MILHLWYKNVSHRMISSGTFINPRSVEQIWAPFALHNTNVVDNDSVITGNGVCLKQ